MVGEKYDMHLADCGEWVIGRPNIFNIQVLIACFYLSMDMSMSMINFKSPVSEFFPVLKYISRRVPVLKQGIKYLNQLCLMSLIPSPVFNQSPLSRAVQYTNGQI